jgi:hypothetical protein
VATAKRALQAALLAHPAALAKAISNTRKEASLLADASVLRVVANLTTVVPDMDKDGVRMICIGCRRICRSNAL